MSRTHISTKYIAPLLCLATISSATANPSSTAIKKNRVEFTQINPGNVIEVAPHEFRLDGESPIETPELEMRFNHLHSLLHLHTQAKVEKYLAGETEPNIIAIDQNNSVSLDQVINYEDYFDLVEMEQTKHHRERAERAIRGEISKDELVGDMLSMMFPVTTEMRVARMPSSVQVINPQFRDAVTSPMVVIGADEYSLSWFRTNIDEITRFNAVVLVTQVNNIIDFQAIQQFAPHLVFQPVAADDLLRSVGVDMYPVLITREGIYQ